MWNNYLFWIVFLPLIVSLVNLILPKIIKKILTFLASITTLIISIIVFTSGELNFEIFNYQLFTTDSLVNFILLFINILSLIILIYSLKNVKKEFENNFFLLFPLTIAFCNGVAISSNIIAFLSFWGLSGLVVFLFGLLKGKEGAESSRKTFVIIGSSDILLLIGLIIIYLTEKSFNLFSININLSTPLSYTAFFCLLLAAFAKAGAFPMHTWIPDFAKNAPIESVALLPAAMDKLLGIYLVARIMMGLFSIPFIIQVIVMILGVFTIIFAVMMALIQHNGRRLLGYHAVSQVGYMVLGLGTGNPIGIIGGLFHMVNHAIYKSSLFLSFGSVEKRTGTPELSELGGLAKVMPFTFIAAIIGALSISGIPPFNGFFSKWMVYQGVLESARTQGAGWQIILNICLVLAVFGSALTLASFVKFIHSIFLGKLQKKLKNIKEISFINWFANNLLALLCVLFGLFVFIIPINLFIWPILRPMMPVGTTLKDILLGFYNSPLIIFMFGVSIILGVIIYFIFKKIRFDDEYVGTRPTTDANRITGTEFYLDIKNVKPLDKIYELAEKKFFDIYAWFVHTSEWFGDIFHKLHTGLLHTYAIWTLAGLVIVTIILISSI